MVDASKPERSLLRSRLHGCMRGVAIGDALGLPFENLSLRRTRRWFRRERYRWLFGYGMISDDTEHTDLLAQSLIASGGDPELFQQQMRKRLRRWLLTLPAGLGRASFLSGLKLCLGASADRSGVFSAGNGPAMRAPILGLSISDLDRLRELNRIQTRITHTDPKAETGALLIAIAAQNPSRSPGEFLTLVRELDLPAFDAFEPLLGTIVERLTDDAPPDIPDLAVELGMGKGVSGYVVQTVPIALACLWRHPNNLVDALEAAILCGGDTDTVAAIVGGLVGQTADPESIPPSLRDHLLEWPRTTAWRERLTEELLETLTTGTPRQPPELSFVGLLLRNAFFFLVVLGHIARRLVPIG